MKIWFDADNGPHVLIMKPLARALQAHGHEVLFTARDRTSTCQLLDHYGFRYKTVGGEFGKGKLDKIRGTLGRAVSLAMAARGWGANVSFGHGSRALPIASRLLRVPSVTMYDYEWVNPTLFTWGCREILLPDVIDGARCDEAGIRRDAVHGYPGFKEELYLADQPLDPDHVREDLKLDPDRVSVLLCPPATNAHYHNPEAEIILEAILTAMSGREDLQLVYLARSQDQLDFLKPHDVRHVIVPRKVYDGPSLIAAMDLMISGGGTMTREAAILGLPSYSFFRGRSGRVDESLTRRGQLIMLESVADVGTKLRLEKRAGEIVAPDNGPLTEHIVGRILSHAR